MLQSASTYTSPANGVSDNSEIIIFETENNKRKYDANLADQFPLRLKEFFFSTLPFKDVVYHYKGVVYEEQSDRAVKEQNVEHKCAKLGKIPFATPYFHIFEPRAMNALCTSFENLELNVLSSFDIEIKRIYETLGVITDELKSTEEEISTVREMIQFLMTHCADSSKTVKERLTAFEVEADAVYNVVLEKLKRITEEWDELPKLKVSEPQREILHQQLCEKQKAFERLFMRSAAFRSSTRTVARLEMRDFTTITIMPDYTNLSVRIAKYWTTAKALFESTRDSSLTETTAHRLLEDITVLSTTQLNYTTKLLCLSKRACEAEHAKKTELQNLYKLFSNVLCKDNAVQKSSDDLDKLEWQFSEQKAELDECTTSKFDDIVEIKQPPPLH